MSTYSLSGSGIQTLTANTTALHIDVTTVPGEAGTGRSNPTAHYDIGLIRFGDATGFWAPIPIVGGPQWQGVPIGTTRIGYAFLHGATADISEVIGGDSPFSGKTGATGAAGGTATNTNSQSFLTGDVTMNSTSTFFDGPSLTIGAGTWLINAGVTCLATDGATAFVAKLWNGTTVYAMSEADSRQANLAATVPFSVVVTLSGSTTVKVSASSDSTNSKMKAQTSRLASGNTATYINAIQLA